MSLLDDEDVLVNDNFPLYFQRFCERVVEPFYTHIRNMRYYYSHAVACCAVPPENMERFANELKKEYGALTIDCTCLSEEVINKKLLGMRSSVLLLYNIFELPRNIYTILVDRVMRIAFRHDLLIIIADICEEEKKFSPGDIVIRLDEIAPCIFISPYSNDKCIYYGNISNPNDI